MRSHLTWLLVTLVACALFAFAGTWQLSRGHEKDVFLAEFQRAIAAEPRDFDVALAAADGLPAPVNGRLRLRTSTTSWLLLDNQRRGAAVGIRAYAVYQTAASVPVLVDFGWQALPPTRQLPLLLAPPSMLEATGLLVDLPSQGLRLGDNTWQTGNDGAVLLAYLDPRELAQNLDLDAPLRVLRLSPDLPIGFARDLDALPNTLPAEKHYGYAFQWFGFAVATLTIYLLLSLRKPRL